VSVVKISWFSSRSLGRDYLSRRSGEEGKGTNEASEHRSGECEQQTAIRARVDVREGLIMKTEHAFVTNVWLKDGTRDEDGGEEGELVGGTVNVNSAGFAGRANT
jgi:hypothetical protein